MQKKCNSSQSMRQHIYLSPFTCLPLPTTAGVKALGALHWLQTSHTECAIHPLSIKGHTVDVSCLIATSACCATLQEWAQICHRGNTVSHVMHDIATNSHYPTHHSSMSRGTRWLQSSFWPAEASVRNSRCHWQPTSPFLGRKQLWLAALGRRPPCTGTTGKSTN